MNKELKLTIKYFIQQKVREILLFLGIGSLAVFIPFSIGKLFFKIFLNSFCILEDYSVSLIETWVFGFLISLILGGIIIIFSWIKSNWEYAKSRAEEDLIIKMKGGKIKWR